MDIDVLVSLVVLVTTIVGSHALLGRELKADISGLKADVEGIDDSLKAHIRRVDDSLKADIRRLDDRVYQLAAGLKPLIEQAERQA